jgi:hypothetical protein
MGPTRDSIALTVLTRRQAGYKGKQVMGDLLTWLMQSSGSSGGFFATTQAPKIASSEFMLCPRP